MGYNSRMDLKNSPSTGGPSKVILVTGAICLSIILASLAYKLTLSQKASAIKNNNIVGLAGTTTDPADLVNNAIYDSQTASLAENASNTSPFAIKSDDSVSDRVSKKLFSGYLYAQQTDGVTDDSVGQVSDAVLSQITRDDLPSPTFSPSQIRVFVPSSKLQIINYGNSVAGIILENFKIIADSNDLSETSKIYKKIASSISLIQTPVEMSTNQANLANSFFMLAQGMDMLGLQTSDPVKALLGVKTLKEVNQSQATVLINIGAYFNKNDIIFSSDDAGSFWNSYINLNNQNNTQTNATTN
jgi:hypothetical protein